MNLPLKPRIETLSELKLLGKRLKMSLADNQTGTLWQSFMPRLKEIQHKTGPELYSVEVYGPAFFEAFDPAAVFEKWAAVAVSGFQDVPAELEPLIIPAGLYAVFEYRGPASQGEPFYRYIFYDWLPASEFTLDNRPHFALMGDKYKYEDPDSEEEIWIPVRLKR